jgi:amino acid adenylation domain-containing protein
VSTTSESLVEGIAIIGAVGRFPGASDLGQFWANLTAGVESVSVLTDAQLTESGFDPRQLRADPRYVPVRGIIERAEWFDAAFFGFTPREAQLTDPQHRLFLEAAWEALESAGCDPARSKGAIGVFAGCGNNTWARRYFARDLDDLESGEWLESAIGNEKDYVATRVAYKLNLRGPAVNVNTACSTSLVAVCQACQALWTYQCDVALAGGVNVSFPQGRGYYHDDEGISSPDGHTRAFDVDARGTVFSNGLGVVVLKRLGEALEDGDEILAVIRGAAINNDGSGKASFTAPSADGQADVVALAQAMAGVSPDSVSYVETHGTATPIGDVIELAGLTKAFRLGTARTQFCAIGSVKSNIGHVEHAAGVAGLIKTALALQHRQIPPSLHYTQPNPKLQVSSSPFFVNHSLREWSNVDSPRRAGVSSFGVGGTNAHVVLEEAPPRPPSGPSHPWHLLPLSAKTGAALDGASSALADFLRSHPETPLADVAFTLQRGRSSFDFRRAVVARCPKEASAILSGEVPGKSIGPERAGDRDVIFMFPGGGAQYCGAARGLYSQLPEFKQQVDACVRAMDARIAAAVSRLVLLAPEEVTVADRELAERPSVGLPMLFAIEFATAQYWLARGVKPAALIGHSLGEYAAACLSGVMALNDAVALVQLRGRLFDELPAGAMLSIGAAADRVTPYLEAGLDVAVINGPASCVVSGRTDKIGALAERLERDGLETVRLHIAVAAHSSLVEPILPEFRSFVSGLRLHVPRVPIVSNVTGTWLSDSEAVNPDYWVDHLRRTVRFSEGLQSLFTRPNAAFLEVGPGRVLSTITRAHPERPSSVIAIESMRHPQDSREDYEALLAAQARLWVNGPPVDWDQEYRGEARRRVALPTYRFERQYFGPVGRTAAGNPSRTVATAVMPSAAPMPEPGGSSLAAPGRQERIAHRLCDVLHELSGLDRATLLGTVTFIELGFDSLSLTQVSQLVLREFRVRVKFRHLLDTLPTVAALAAHLDREMPPEAPAPSVGSSELVSSTLAAMARLPEAAAMLQNASNPPEFVQEVIRQQLALMTQQIAVLQGTAATARSSSSTDRQTAAPASVQDRPLDAGGLGAVAAMGRLKPEQLTPQQRRYLAEFTERYTARTTTSKELTQRFRLRHADPRTASGFTGLWKELVYPIVVSRSMGSRLWDVDGNEYIDLLCGFGPTFLGHGHEVIVDAINQQLARGFELGPQTPLAGEVAELFCELTGQERVSFVNTGSEAVQAALRIARTVTGRTKVATFTRDYHGNFDEMLVRGLRRGNEPRTVPSAPGIPQRAVDDVVVLDYGTEASLEFLKRSAHELAAIVVEPIQSRRPEFQPREFLHALRALTQTSETLLVFDEVVTGLRIGPGGAQAHFGIQADLATYGKVLGGGMPIGAVAGQAEFMDTFDGGQWQYGDASMPVKPVTFFAGTFARHPLAIAAAKATLTYLKARGQSLWDGLNTRSDRLADGLDAICRREGIPVRVPHFRSMMYPRIEEGHGLAYLLFYELRARGVYLHEPYPCYLNLAHSDEDIDRVVGQFEAAVSCLRANGVFERAQALASPPAPTRMSAIVKRKELPLTPGQMEIWLAARMSPAANCAYNEIAAVRLAGAVNVAAIDAAVQQLALRHDALRLTIRPDGSAQSIADACDCRVSFVDLSAVPEHERNGRLDEIIEQEQHQPFDLEHGPLFRTRLVRFSEAHHVLLFNGHHLVCDGWSLGVILKDLSALYSAAAESREPVLGRALQFSEYVDRYDSTSAEVTEARRYWLDQFRETAPVLDLPTSGVRARQRSYAARRTTAVLGPTETKALKSSAIKHRCTPFALLVATYGAMLHRLSAQDDVVVGIAAGGQSQIGEADLVGHCVSLLPYRSRITAEVAASSYLADVQKSLLDAFEHQSVTFGSLLNELDVPREANRVPLVSAIITHEIETPGIDFAGLVTTHQFVPRAFCNFDLELYLCETSDGGLTVEFYGNADLITQETLERWTGYYLKLAHGLAESSQELLGRLAMLGTEERDELITGWNPPPVERERNLTATVLVAEQVAARPDKIAVECDGRQLTYRELNNRANALAVVLARYGVKPEVVVGVMVERSVDMAVAVLGILKAGGAYLPLDPAYPTSRLAYMLYDAGVRVVVSHRGLESRVSAGAATIVRLEDVPRDVGAERPGEVAIGPDNIAYLIYTSGSTGNPKGVEVTHGNLVNVLLSIAREPGFTASDSTLAVTTLSFDVAAAELLLPLVRGGKVIIAPQETLQDGRQLRSLVEKTNPTFMHPTPVSWRLLLEAGWDGSADLTIASTGEPLPRDLAEELLSKGKALWNLYGPTETAIWSTGYQVSSDIGTVPIGRPIDNTQIYVLDRWLQPVPVGVVGELYIGGHGVARGYRGRPELTAERFIPDPFSATPSRLYRTGDLARYRPDGNIECLARADQQVKLRGFRIELGEIEAALNAQPGVIESVVVLSSGSDESQRHLVGYVTPAELRPETLREALRAILPGHMVPAIIVALESLPRTPNGKIDRRSLPVPLPSVRELQPSERPADPVEERIATIFRDVLNGGEIGRHDNFFDHGGDSLQAMRVLARIQDLEGVYVSVQDFFMGPTVANLAEATRSAMGRPAPALSAPITRVRRARS